MDAKPSRKYKDKQACLSDLYPTCVSKWKDDVEKAKTEPGASMRKAVTDAFEADTDEYKAKYSAWMERHPEEKQKLQAMRDRKKATSTTTSATTTTTTTTTSPAPKRVKSGIDEEPEIARVVSELNKELDVKKENITSFDAEIESIRKDLKRSRERFDEDTKRAREKYDQDAARVEARLSALEDSVRPCKAIVPKHQAMLHKLDGILSSIQTS
jgi:predicted  nucleic acid-binding Zn-ribbon protein